MFDEYVDKQDIAYNIFYNSIKNNKVSHAYLIDENNNSSAFNLIMNFVKEIICTDIEETEKAIICQRINDGNYAEVKIIEPDGMLIKKQQIINLQQEFSRTAVEGRKRVYIIRDCDKMRPETANAMLKFLEEPDNNIVAILMTNNYNSILPTIISRCQNIKLNSDKDVTLTNEYVDIILDFIINLENNGRRVFLKKDNFWIDKNISKDRNLLIKLFDMMVDIYYDMVKIKSDMKNIKYMEHVDKLRLIADKNDTNRLLEKINYLIMSKDSIKFNVNVNLLMDGVIINIGG